MENYNENVDELVDEYSKFEKWSNQYSQDRGNYFKQQVNAPIQEKAYMESMVSEMRKQKKEVVLEQRKKMFDSIAKGEAVKLPKFSGKEVDFYDYSYVIAESLQKLYSVEDPKAEYHDWIDAQQRIETDINTGGTTDEEIASRNNFIGFLDERETELKMVIALYSSAANSGKGYGKAMAEHKLQFLRFKLNRLRDLRSRTEATKSKSDRELEQEKQFEKDFQRNMEGFAVGTVSTIAAIETAKKMHQAMENKVLDGSFSNATEGVMVKFRPVTQTREDVEHKQEILTSNKAKFKKIMELRGISGSSKPQYSEKQNTRYKGFTGNAYINAQLKKQHEMD